VGEYVHQLARALAQPGEPDTRHAPRPAVEIASPPPTPDDIVVFSSSWKDRLRDSDVGQLGPVHAIDLRWPVGLLNFSWHRVGWPPVELLTGERFDVVHSPHPLLLPSRHAAQVVTVHDLDFLANPDRVTAEIRRDYGALAKAHAHRADRVIVPSAYTAGLVQSRLGVAAERISVCPEGVPEWAPESAGSFSGRPRGFILFIGTLEARKNVAGLLAAYRRLLARHPAAPDLVLAGKAPPEAAPLLAALGRAPLAGRVAHVGYVRPDRRQALYRDAGLLVLPSFDEGFGLPVVEAMSLGVPVIASNRGALPEVLGDAGLLVDPDDPESLATAMASVLADTSLAAALSARGTDRARMFSWRHAAALTREAYALAVATNRERRLRRQILFSVV
jgi:glycosyltransferase involved in cell wall biosynthesis